MNRRDVLVGLGAAAIAGVAAAPTIGDGVALYAMAHPEPFIPLVVNMDIGMSEDVFTHMLCELVDGKLKFTPIAETDFYKLGEVKYV